MNVKNLTLPLSDDRTSATDDERIGNVTPMPSPEALIRFFPIQGTKVETLVAQTRRNVHDILDGASDRLLVIMGPCSIHDPQAALEYAGRLALERKRLSADIELVMRVYFEKPRTTVGWKGLINDPYLNGSFHINEGLRIARDLLVRINQAGVPAGSEFLDTISPQYIGDLISWGAIGARTTESQVHRELASGISASIGFKNGTDGSAITAINAMEAAARPHHFLGINGDGQAAIVSTTGNPDGHLVLRGGKGGTNYHLEAVDQVSAQLAKAGLPHRVMVDCSHGNSNKDYRRQSEVASEVAEQLRAGSSQLMGVMLESHLVAGSQKIPTDLAQLQRASLTYGQSITDACIDLATTAAALDTLAQAVAQTQLVLS